jgi:predicted acyl esterase
MTTQTCHRRNLVLLAAGLPLLVLGSSGLQLGRSQTEARYEVHVSNDVMIPMRDGAKLATDIYRPAQDGAPVDGRFPVIMERTPYNKSRGGPGLAGYFVPRGYVVVVQDVRGRYKSEGRWRPIREDPADGADTAKWIGAQPWCDGGIGTVGTSYAGATQHALAIGNAPVVKTMIPVDAMSNFGRYGVRLDISSSNFPRFDVNPNTGEPLNANRRWRVAENSIYHDPRHASHIILPVIPAR